MSRQLVECLDHPCSDILMPQITAGVWKRACDTASSTDALRGLLGQLDFNLLRVGVQARDAEAAYLADLGRIAGGRDGFGLALPAGLQCGGEGREVDCSRVGLLSLLRSGVLQAARGADTLGELADCGCTELLDDAAGHG